MMFHAINCPMPISVHHTDVTGQSSEESYAIKKNNCQQGIDRNIRNQYVHIQYNRIYFSLTLPIFLLLTSYFLSFDVFKVCAFFRDYCTLSVLLASVVVHMCNNLYI